MSNRLIPSWVADAIDDAKQPVDWNRLVEEYEDSLGVRASEAASSHPRLQERKIRGVYYTPEPLARQLTAAALGPILAAARQEIAASHCDSSHVERVVEQVRELRILDPACGTGVFLIVAGEMLHHFYSWVNYRMQRVVVEPSTALTQLYGVEIDPVAVEICRRRLRGSVLKCDGDSANIICADTLRSDRLPTADIILTNPPFEVLTNFASNPQAAALATWIRRSRMYPISSRGQINLYRLFLERCIHHLPAGGSLGIVLPLGFVGDIQSAKLRQHLLHKMRLERVTLISEHSRAFTRAAQGVALLVARKGDATDRVMIEHLRSLNNGSATSSSAMVDMDLIKRLSSDLWVMPRCHPKLLPVLVRMSSYPRLSGDEGTPAVANVFVGELDQTIHRHFICEQPTDMLLVRGEHIGERYFVRLTEGGPGRYVDPAFVLDGIISTIKRAHLSQPRLIFQGIANLGLSRRLRFALCPSGVVLGNSVNYLSFVNGDVGQAYYYLGLLNSRLMNWRFCATSYGNNISNYEIGCLPIIPYHQAGALAEEVAYLAIQLEGYAKKRLLETPEARELDRRLDRLIYRAYDISADEQDLIEIEE